MSAVAGDKWTGTGLLRGLPAAIDFATRSHARAAMVLVVVALLSFLPGFFTVPPTDRDEARFAQATKQMIESGDFIDIRFQDTTRYKKPVGIYWLQAGAVQTAHWLGLPRAHTSIWLYRLPSLLGAIGAVLLTYWAALAFVTRRAAVLAALMMATCILLAVEARIAKTDACLLATAVAVMGALARVYLPERRATLDSVSVWAVPAIFWTALAAAVLLKGPVIPLFTALAMLTLVAVDRSARWLLPLRPLLGMAWFALLVLPWFLAITMRAGDEFFSESLAGDLFAKLFQGQESHGAPPGYYFLLFWGTFWPAATLAVLAAPAAFAARREPGARFLLAWVVPAWVLLELVVTKLPHYVLPLYPAIAILIAGVIDARVASAKPWAVRATIWWFIVPTLLGILAIVAMTGIGRQFGLIAWPVIGAAMIMGFLAWRLYTVDGSEHSFLRSGASAVLILGTVFWLVAPSLTMLFPSVTLAKILRESECRTPLAAAAGYHEPSLVFLAGTSTRLIDGAGAADFLRGGECRYAFIEARHERGFAQRAEAIGLRYSSGPRIEAINVSNGRTIMIAVYRSGAPQ
jgi:4-amino-4-deoxy-L-arabinose transferase-like glycosyltransferase